MGGHSRAIKKRHRVERLQALVALSARKSPNLEAWNNLENLGGRVQMPGTVRHHPWLVKLRSSSSTPVAAVPYLSSRVELPHGASSSMARPPVSSFHLTSNRVEQDRPSTEAHKGPTRRINCTRLSKTTCRLLPQRCPKPLRPDWVLKRGMTQPGKCQRIELPQRHLGTGPAAAVGLRMLRFSKRQVIARETSI